MSVYSGDEKIINYGTRYLHVMAFTYILQGLSLTTTIILRSISKVKIPLFSTIIAFFMNIFFNWVFIFGNLGAPRLEIAGAAIGTLFARIFEFIIIFGYFIIVEKDIRYRVADFFKPCKKLLPKFILFSVPVVISDLLLGLGNNAVAIVMGHIGAEFVSANAIITVVVQISTIFTQGVSSASSIVTGNTLGEGEKEKAYHQGVTFFALSVMIGLAAGIIIMVLAPTVIGFYNIKEDTRRVALELMKAVAFTVIFQTVSNVMTKGVLRGGGDTKFLMVADILFLWIVSVPVGAFVGLVLHAPAFWIFTAMKLDQIIKSVWCTKRLYSRKWIKIVKV
jgi:putative MATE family efflux protein